MTAATKMSWDEIKALVASLAIQSQETDRKFQETRELIRELREASKETDRRFQETERLLKARSEETDRKFQETRELFDRLSRRFGDLGNRLGEFVEAMVEPSLVRLFRARGLDVSEVHRGISIQRGQEGLEIDLFVVDGDTAVAVECKSRLTAQEVERHLERMAKIKRLMPAYRNHRLHGAVAGMTLDVEAIALAEREGLWVLGQSGETVEVKNHPGFEPRVW